MHMYAGTDQPDGESGEHSLGRRLTSFPLACVSSLSPDSSSMAGAIVGGVIGALVIVALLVLIVILAVYIIFKLRSKSLSSRDGVL